MRLAASVHASSSAAEALGDCTPRAHWSGTTSSFSVLDRMNRHLFQPLLHQVATASLAATSITALIRWLLRGQRNATVLMTGVETMDTERRVVIAEGGAREFQYDFLIVAAGARHAYSTTRSESHTRSDSKA